MRKRTLVWLAAIVCVASLSARAQSSRCDQFPFTTPPAECTTAASGIRADLPAVVEDHDQLLQSRVLKYSSIEGRHRLCGLASFYSASLDGTLTANGERYRMMKLSAAHLTLPLGSWVEVTARSTGKHLRLRVNDRGPYVDKFMLDLSYAAAHALGVDEAEDRHVDVRIIALPGEQPLPEDFVWAVAGVEERPADLVAR